MSEVVSFKEASVGRKEKWSAEDALVAAQALIDNSPDLVFENVIVLLQHHDKENPDEWKLTQYLGGGTSSLEAYGLLAKALADRIGMG